MGWESRKTGGNYYTRSKRVNGRIVRQYIGTGPTGELAAAEDQERRQAATTELQQLHAIQEAEQALESMLTQLETQTNQFAAWLLLAAGCHRPKRQWRKKREHRRDPASG